MESQGKGAVHTFVDCIEVLFKDKLIKAQVLLMGTLVVLTIIGNKIG